MPARERCSTLTISLARHHRRRVHVTASTEYPAEDPGVGQNSRARRGVGGGPFSRLRYFMNCSVHPCVGPRRHHGAEDDADTATITAQFVATESVRSRPSRPHRPQRDDAFHKDSMGGPDGTIRQTLPPGHSTRPSPSPIKATHPTTISLTVSGPGTAAACHERRRAANPRPARPRRSSERLAGSGTPCSGGGLSGGIAGPGGPSVGGV